MKIFLSIIFFYSMLSFSARAEVKISKYKDYKITNIEFHLEEVSKGFNYPWGMTFVDDVTLLITEKKGALYKVNLIAKTKEIVSHDLNLIAIRQGGLLDVLYHDGYVYFSYTHDIEKKYSSTAIARGNLIDNSIKNLEILFIASPKIKYADVHFGSRLTIKDNYLYASIGERGQGIMAQDPLKHPGSIIRINLDGSIPTDNPMNINGKEWLPEIYQIGIRNPQGMTLSPYDNKVYISNHGAKGGDFIGTVNKGGNYGWNLIGWGGKNYDFTKIGDGKPFKDEFDKPLISWVPSIAPSNIKFYDGNLFKEWKGDLLVTSLKFNMLVKLKIKDNKIIDEKIILKGCKLFEDNCYNIGRMRDIEIDKSGAIYIITDEPDSSLWKMYR